MKKVCALTESAALSCKFSKVGRQSSQESASLFSGLVQHMQSVRVETCWPTSSLRDSKSVSLDEVHAQYDWTTGVLDNGHEWRKFRVVPRSHPLRPLRCTLCLTGLETEGLLKYQGRAAIISTVRWNLCPVIFGVDKGVSSVSDMRHRRDHSLGMFKITIPAKMITCRKNGFEQFIFWITSHYRTSVIVCPD